MFGLRITVALVLVCARFAAFNKGLILISSPSDLAVWEGVMIMIGYAVAAAYIGRWIFSWVKTIKLESLEHDVVAARNRGGIVFHCRLRQNNSAGTCRHRCEPVRLTEGRRGFSAEDRTSLV
jgi:hypothetical protein